MIFNTWTFGFFLIIFLAIYWLLLKPGWRPVGLIIASIAFYAYFATAYILLIVLLALFVFASGSIIKKYKSSGKNIGFKNPFVLLWLSITVCVLVLGYYKYLGLLISSVNQLLGTSPADNSLAIPQVVVPLGLSFFIFEFIHYLVDSYHGRTKNVTLLEFCVFALFFPTMVSGPIKRFQPFVKQLRSSITYKPEYITDGFTRIITGLAKKLLIADIVGAYALPLTDFSKNPGVNTWVLWAGVYAYAIRIYFDFSGYSDIAIGCAKLLGFTIPENFNKPYLKRNIAEFWRNWHMSLTSWLTDYIYMPIGKKLMPIIGKKHPLLLATICQLATMGVSGIWHGAAWHFLIWGLFHGVGLTIHRIYSEYITKIKRKNKVIKIKSSNIYNLLGRSLSTIFTFHFVCIGWVFFVLNLNDAIKVIYRLLFLPELGNLLGL